MAVNPLAKSKKCCIFKVAISFSAWCYNTVQDSLSINVHLRETGTSRMYTILAEGKREQVAP